LLTYHGGDPGISHSGPVEEIKNQGGIVGALFADLFFYLFGFFAYLFPPMVGYMGWIIYQGHHHDILAEPKSLIVPGIGFVLTLSILGLWVGNGLVAIVDRLGATLILLAVFFTGVTLLTGLSWLKLMDTLGYYTLNHGLPVAEKYMNKQFLPWFQWTKTAYTRWKDRRAEWRTEREQYYMEDAYEDEYDDDYFIREKPSRDEITSRRPKTLPEVTPAAAQSPPVVKITPSSLLPALNLLNPVSEKKVVTSPTVQMLPQQIIEAFAALKVEIEVNTLHQGPVLTNFEVHTITAINTNHLDELGRALAKVLRVENVRVVETQPEMLGVEMPNFKRQKIYFSELLNSAQYQENTSPLAVVLGEDIAGEPVVVDLTHIPHILMADCEGKEKNVAINTLILSLLYKSTPQGVRLLLIDSTSRALSIYADLPHLLMPVITDMAQTPPALQWCVKEMERRYRLMAQMGVRNIEDYNQALLIQGNEQAFLENQAQTALFYIVIIFNEIAELVAAKVERSIEQSITRLTQKARAAGIHMILATQHPTVNVITGLIKANIPTRMAFQVNNQNESRIILGQVGAETLLGHGDMLYMTAGTGMPVRVHSSFVSEPEVQKVVADLKSRATPDYVDMKME